MRASDVKRALPNLGFARAWAEVRDTMRCKRTKGARMALRVPEITIIGGIALFVTAPVMGVEQTTPIPDFAGNWARTTFALEQPDSGPGPVRTLRRRAEGSAGFN